MLSYWGRSSLRCRLDLRNHLLGQRADAVEDPAAARRQRPGGVRRSRGRRRRRRFRRSVRRRRRRRRRRLRRRLRRRVGVCCSGPSRFSFIQLQLERTTSNQNQPKWNQRVIETNRNASRPDSIGSGGGSDASSSDTDERAGAGVSVGGAVAAAAAAWRLAPPAGRFWRARVMRGFLGSGGCNPPPVEPPPPPGDNCDAGEESDGDASGGSTSGGAPSPTPHGVPLQL